MLSYQRSALAAAFVASTLATSSGTLCAGEPAPHLALQILSQDSVSNEDRKVVAKIFETFCGKLNGKIPTLSPRENDWLNAEIDARRGLSLYDSEEFAKRKSKQTLGQCHHRASVLSNDWQAGGEVLLWALFVSSILDHNLLNHIENLRDSNSFDITDRDVAFVSIFPMMADEILNKILIPTMMRLNEEK